MRNRPRPYLSSGAFTILELLVVISIVVLLSVFALNAFNQTLSGSRLASTAQQVSDAMGLARSIALARNIPVQIRFYKLPISGPGGAATTAYRGLQIFTCELAATNTVTKPYLFPEPIVTSADTKKSSLFSISEITPGPSDPQRISGAAYTYVPVTFGADGRIQSAANGSLTSTNEWYVTIETQRDLNSDTTWPNNYATVKINPVTGNTKIFQPR